MAITWIVQPGRREWTEYSLMLTCIEHPSSGYSFDCDAAGNLLADDSLGITVEQRQAQLAAVVAGGHHTAPKLMRHERSYFEPGSIRCHCGREHHLQRGDSTCDCGQDYNACGQQLLPPHLWEEPWDED